MVLFLSIFTLTSFAFSGDELRWKFASDSSMNGWGWRLTVYPMLAGGHVRGSDRAVLSQPSVELATCLLDARLTLTSDRVLIARLATAMAACAQLSTLGMLLPLLSYL